MTIERRIHIHAQTPDGTAKFWLEPIVALSDYYNLSSKELKEIEKIVEEKQNEFKSSWKKHFGQ